MATSDNDSSVALPRFDGSDFVTVSNSLDRHDRPAHEALGRIRRAIREVEAAARKKAFEDAEAACRAIRENAKSLQSDPILGAAFCGEAAGADQCMRAIVKLWERAKEVAK